MGIFLFPRLLQWRPVLEKWTQLHIHERVPLRRWFMSSIYRPARFSFIIIFFNKNSNQISQHLTVWWKISPCVSIYFDLFKCLLKFILESFAPFAFGAFALLELQLSTCFGMRVSSKPTRWSAHQSWYFMILDLNTYSLF